MAIFNYICVCFPSMLLLFVAFVVFLVFGCWPGLAWFVLYVGAIDIQIIVRLGLCGVMCLVSGILVFLYVGR